MVIIYFDESYLLGAIKYRADWFM